MAEQQSGNGDRSHQAFVIARVGSPESAERKRADEVFEHIIEPAVEQVGLKAVRQDLDNSPGPITPKIVRNLIESRLVIADLTGSNPNVFYELGIAQAFGRPVVFLVQSLSDGLPFDVKDEAAIVIGDQELLEASVAKSACGLLAGQLEAVLADGYLVHNLISQVATTASLDALTPDNPVGAELASIRSLLDELVAQYDVADSFTTADMDSLMSFVEMLSKRATGLPPTFYTEELVNPETSLAFDRWVDGVTTAAGDAIEERNAKRKSRDKEVTVDDF